MGTRPHNRPRRSHPTTHSPQKNISQGKPPSRGNPHHNPYCGTGLWNRWGVILTLRSPPSDIPHKGVLESTALLGCSISVTFNIMRRARSGRTDIRATHRHGLKGQRQLRRPRFRFGAGRSKFQGFGRRPTEIGRAVPGFQRTSGFFGRFGAGGELKFHDVDLDDASIDQGATITPSINLIAQGTTESQRIGRKCTIRSINWRFRLNKSTVTAATATAEIIRVILYLDKQCNGATAAVADILETDDFQSFNNLANKSRFRTLMDRTYVMEAQAGGGDGTTEDYGETIISDDLFKKVNIPVEFSATTGAITEIRSNNIGVLIISETGGLASFASKIRLRFSDT